MLVGEVRCARVVSVLLKIVGRHEVVIRPTKASKNPRYGAP